MPSLFSALLCLLLRIANECFRQLYHSDFDGHRKLFKSAWTMCSQQVVETFTWQTLSRIVFRLFHLSISSRIMSCRIAGAFRGNPSRQCLSFDIFCCSILFRILADLPIPLDPGEDQITNKLPKRMLCSKPDKPRAIASGSSKISADSWGRQCSSVCNHSLLSVHHKSCLCCMASGKLFRGYYPSAMV